MNEAHLPTSPIQSAITRAFSDVFAMVLFAISYFCLWNVSNYLVNDVALAWLFLPSGLKLAVYALSHRRLWWRFTLVELAGVTAVGYGLDDFAQGALLAMFALFVHAAAIPFRAVWLTLDVYWKKLLALCCFAFAYAVICGLTLIMMVKPMGLSVEYAVEGAVTVFTGGILLTPFFYLLYDYLHRQIWQPLSPTLVHQEVALRSSGLIWCLIFFSVGLTAELTLLDEMKPLALILFLLPNIFMAYQYGWQGGVLASVMNSILLATAKQVAGSFDTDLELQTFVATQAIIGLGLGIAISRQHLLSHRLQQVNSDLAKELDNKRLLARQLVQVEEDIRKSVARELHDEIGQNITAIQIQAMLAKRIAPNEQCETIATTTNDLAMRIHTSTRQLLTQLRPQALDEMGLENAIRQLVGEMKFKERHVDFQLNFGVNPDRLDDITAVTLYRVVQELLNNVCKHSQATLVHLTLIPGERFSLEIRDNGIGIPANWRSLGQGLTGIEERVSALGGQLAIGSHDGAGSKINVNLPTKHITSS